jgi:hypothetical protein
MVKFTKKKKKKEKSKTNSHYKCTETRTVCLFNTHSDDVNISNTLMCIYLGLGRPSASNTLPWIRQTSARNTLPGLGSLSARNTLRWGQGRKCDIREDSYTD